MLFLRNLNMQTGILNEDPIVEVYFDGWQNILDKLVVYFPFQCPSGNAPYEMKVIEHMKHLFCLRYKLHCNHCIPIM